MKKKLIKREKSTPLQIKPQQGISLISFIDLFCDNIFMKTARVNSTKQIQDLSYRIINKVANWYMSVE